MLCISKLPTIRASSQEPSLYVEPKASIFYASVTSVGYSFTIGVKTASWASLGVFGYEMKLYYNNTFLEGVAGDFPRGHWLEPTGPIIEPPGTIEIHQQEGFVIAACTLLGPESGRTGGGTLFTVTFRIVQAPLPGESISCVLELRDVIMVDPDARLIPGEEYVVLNGNYVLSAREDLNRDGRVNILDMAIWALAYHSHPGDVRWNPKADLNGDGEINILDVTPIAKAWTW
jgi:hypothetical protein